MVHVLLERADIMAIQNHLALELIPVLLDVVVLDHNDHNIHLGEELVEVENLVLDNLFLGEEGVEGLERTGEVALLDVEHLEGRALADVIDILLVGEAVEADAVVVGEVITNDSCPENLGDVRITFSKGGSAFNPVTGLSSTDSGFTYPITGIVPYGENRIAKLRSNFFLTTDEETMDVTIQVLSASGTVLNTRTVTGVPFKRNRTTILTGSLFSTSSSASFSVENSWTDGVTQNF